MVYAPAPYMALQAANSFREVSGTEIRYSGKDNWSRSLPHGPGGHAKGDLTVASPPSSLIKISSDSDAEVELATESAPLPTSSANDTEADDSELRSSTSVSDWCAQLVCYIWFGGASTSEPNFTVPAPSSPVPRLPGRSSVQSSPVARRHSKKLSLGSLSESTTFSVRDLHHAVEAHARSNADTGRSRPTAQERSSDPRALRLYPRRRFTEFVRNMLNTTQVSKSVIVLALLYIHRLKSKNPGLRGQDGSEFRLFVTALMLANKFLDDHTYTNKTWSELSGLKLKDVTKMEIEFWLGLSSNIYVSDVDFRNWIGTLEVLAERRQLALHRHEQEKARQQALRQQQEQQHLQHQHQHQQQMLLLQQQQQSQHFLGAPVDAARRIAHNSRTPQTRSWSPESQHHDRRARSSPVLVPSHLSPVCSAGPVPGHRSSVDLGTPFAISETIASTGHHQPPRPSSSASTQDFHLGNKRSLAQYSGTSPLQDRHMYATPSPERACKRRNLAAERDPRTISPPNRAYGLSPPFAQPCPRSVFEPLISTPNTLLAPYAMHRQAGVCQQQKQYPLAYWQLAAGHDRGILGLHLPAPIPCQNDYFDHVAHGQAASRAQQQYDRLMRKPLATTTPYPTPPIDAFPSCLPGQTSFNTDFLSGGQSMPALSGNQAAYLPQAPHAPFNNAQAHYVDPLYIRY
ncbi:hypothetical protein BCV70DRAFT_162583 [Testicularia cyperi]|uniref:Cyclin-domain-containing protein n=1 Tax=Testicularia cyperi TaxID=1882483 RepID=A0A317XNI5_9BASI|nr:hypothetical protein BCV70DRAFT_162583 [Testicularia cyperi]